MFANQLSREIFSLSSGVEYKYGVRFYTTLSADLRKEMAGIEGLSESNIRYAKRFFQLYSSMSRNFPQVVENLCSVPWGYHRYIINKFSEVPEKALFYVHQTIENGWSRAMFLNFMDTGLYERQGKAVTNFQHSLPVATSDLAQEITKGPYNFDFLSMRKGYNERQFKKFVELWENGCFTFI